MSCSAPFIVGPSFLPPPLPFDGVTFPPTYHPQPCIAGAICCTSPYAPLKTASFLQKLPWGATTRHIRHVSGRLLDSRFQPASKSSFFGGASEFDIRRQGTSAGAFSASASVVRAGVAMGRAKGNQAAGAGAANARGDKKGDHRTPQHYNCYVQASQSSHAPLVICSGYPGLFLCREHFFELPGFHVICVTFVLFASIRWIAGHVVLSDDTA